ncbi:MAG: T9SS type A sorting domain-containing protein [Crocinitomicaceae bacterium]|nr:T9SS type A sorting domain-containing protein [Crocinitomicaceae bacterium]
MKHIILSIISILFCLSVNAQGTWTQLSDIPGAGRHHACSFVIDDTAYVATGSGTSDFFKYDIHSDTWSQLPDFPGGNRNFAIGFSINGKGYISCGYDGSNSYMDMWEFDPATQNWTQKSSGPAVGRVHPAFSVVGDNVYIGQGQQDISWADINDWYEYNMTTDTWTVKTPGMSARHHGAGATVGNKIYVGTGHHLDTMFDDWYSYDSNTDTWQTLTNFPGNGRSAGNSVARQGKIYFFAGEDEINFARFDDFREYDPVTDSWNSLPSFPAGGRWAPFMFVHNDTIYVGAGEDEQVTVRNDLWRFDFSTADINEFTTQSIQVFPNPATEKIYIPNISNANITIYDCMGRIVLKTKINGSSLNITSLESGTYHVQIEDSTYRIRFLKK